MTAKPPKSARKGVLRRADVLKVTETATTAGAPVGAVTNVVIPSVLTAVAFGVASHFGLVGDLPLWVLLTLLVGAGVLGEATAKLVRPDASAFALHSALAAQLLSVSAIIYALG